MKGYKETSKVPYATVVVSLIYGIICTRLDIIHAVEVVSRFLYNQTMEHSKAVKWILRCMRGTSKACLCVGSDESMLDGYRDSDMVGDVNFRKSISRFW